MTPILFKSGRVDVGLRDEKLKKCFFKAKIIMTRTGRETDHNELTNKRTNKRLSLQFYCTIL